MTAKIAQNWALRIAFSVVFIWFGVTKMFDSSPATSLVLDLLNKTLPFFPPQQFLFLFGVLEVLIGFGFFISRYLKLTYIVTFFHLCATMLPIVLLPQHTWLSVGVLSTEGQYIMKNLILFAGLWGLWLDLPHDSRNSGIKEEHEKANTDNG